MVSGACKEQKKFQFSYKGRLIPKFSSEPAYHYIQQQVDFGLRAPNTEGHQQTRKYLEFKLKFFASRNFVYAQGNTIFGEYWQTHNDDMDIINK